MKPALHPGASLLVRGCQLAMVVELHLTQCYRPDNLYNSKLFTHSCLCTIMEFSFLITWVSVCDCMYVAILFESVMVDLSCLRLLRAGSDQRRGLLLRLRNLVLQPHHGALLILNFLCPVSFSWLLTFSLFHWLEIWFVDAPLRVLLSVIFCQMSMIPSAVYPFARGGRRPQSRFLELEVDTDRVYSTFIGEGKLPYLYRFVISMYQCLKLNNLICTIRYWFSLHHISRFETLATVDCKWVN